MWDCCRNNADSSAETKVNKPGNSGIRGAQGSANMVHPQKEQSGSYPKGVNYSFHYSTQQSSNTVTSTSLAQGKGVPPSGGGIRLVGNLNPSSEDGKRVSASLPPFDKLKGPHSGTPVMQGPFAYPDGATYQGEFNSGRREGFGVQVWPDGSFYEGFWLNDKHHYYGRLIHSDGDFYEGEWKDNMAQGKGKYKRPNGVEYNGEWMADLQHGFGIEVDPSSGTRYEGRFQHGKKQGQGLATFSNGHKYSGEFQDNMMHGKGEYTWSDGRVYVGTFFRNKMEGEGRFRWPTGMEYVGAFVNDRKEGFGTLCWPDGSKYVGNFIDGKQDGEGTLFDARGTKTMGIWRKGELVSTKPGY